MRRGEPGGLQNALFTGAGHLVVEWLKQLAGQKQGCIDNCKFSRGKEKNEEASLQSTGALQRWHAMWCKLLSLLNELARVRQHTVLLHISSPAAIQHLYIIKFTKSHDAHTTARTNVRNENLKLAAVEAVGALKQFVSSV